MIYFNEEMSFDEIIQKGIVLVVFFANWCGPCKMLNPILEEVEKEKGSVKIIKIDVDRFPNLARKYGVMSIPSLKVFKEGKELRSIVGYLPKDELLNLLNV